MTNDTLALKQRAIMEREKKNPTLTRGIIKGNLKTEYLSVICSDPTQTVAASKSYAATDKDEM